MSNEQLVRRYVEAILGHDLDALDRLRHRDWSAVWPQSGERVTNTQDWRQIVDNYPGGRPELVSERLIGSEDRWVVSPLGGAYRVGGEGENWWSEWRMTYPDGRLFWSIVLLELRGGKVYCETSYWAEPFDPPAWRAQWVQRQEGERPPGRGRDDHGPGPVG